MHEHWQDMISFYVAGSLPADKAHALEQHLAGCATCQQSVAEWRRIAEVVRAEADGWSRKLPPLAPEIRARLAERRDEATLDETVAYPVLTRRASTPMRRSWNAFTLVAAVFTLVIFGGAVAFMMNQQNDTREASATQVAMQTGALTEEVRDLPDATSEADASPAPTATPLANDLGILSVDSPTNTIVPTERPTERATRAAGDDASLETPSVLSTQSMSIGFGGGGLCTATSATGASVSVYGEPGSPGATGLLPGDAAVLVWTASGTGWYQIGGEQGGIIGWVHESTIMLNGVCDNVLLPTPTITGVPCTASSNVETYLYRNRGVGDDVMATIQPFEFFTIVGIDEQSIWYGARVMVAGVEQFGWVNPSSLTLFGSCQALPFLSADGFTVPPTPFSTDTPTPTASAPQVSFFYADRASLAPGDTVTLIWETSGMDSVWVEFYGSDVNSSHSDSRFRGLPASGTLVVTIPLDYPHAGVTFVLGMEPYEDSALSPTTSFTLPLNSAP